MEVYRPFLIALSESLPEGAAIDLGCGRGEWLELLASTNLIGEGVDTDASMVAEATGRGLRVKNLDALERLKLCQESSLALITAFHLVEHIPFSTLQEIISESYRCLAPGGLLFLETPNPENLRVSTLSFHLDPTHLKPLPPELLAFAVEYSGFERVKILRLNEDQALRHKKSLAFIDVINGVSPDYVVIAQKKNECYSASMDEAFSTKGGLSLEELAYEYDSNHRILNSEISNINSEISNIHDWLRRIDRALKDQGAWVLDFSKKHAELIFLNSAKIDKLELDFQDNFKNLVRKKLQEFYWTLTRLFGLAYLHDGSVAEAPQNLEIVTNDYQFKLSLPGQPIEVNLGFNRLRFFLEAVKRQPAPTASSDAISPARPRLAFVTPLPPQRTGIADYSHELLPHLAKYYDITVIVENATSVVEEVDGILKIESYSWLESHALLFDRVLYQIGNSDTHTFMLDLIMKIPGVIVLHDFYLGHFLASLDESTGYQGLWIDELYRSEGYAALVKRNAVDGHGCAVMECPVNFTIIQQSLGIIFHSRYSRNLMTAFYRPEIVERCTVIPHGRNILDLEERKVSRINLSIPDDAFVVCSFGFVGENKLSMELLDAWRQTNFLRPKKAFLFFVGEAPPGAYSSKLTEKIENDENIQVRVTGFVPQNIYRLYLSACDLAVQLRTGSRGETSGATLDCMGAGKPTIVVNHGPFSELPDDSVVKLTEGFGLEELSALLSKCEQDPDFRLKIGQKAKSFISDELSFSHVAQSYFKEIEHFYETGAQISKVSSLAQIASVIEKTGDGNENIVPHAVELAKGVVMKTAQPQLLIDISALVREDLKSGVQRVVKSQLAELFNNPPKDYRIEPIYLSEEDGRPCFKYANKFTLDFLDLRGIALEERAISYQWGDKYYMPDLNYGSVIRASDEGLYASMKEAGVELNFVVFDNLPILMPHYFPSNADKTHAEWLRHVVNNADRLVCISDTVRTDISSWIGEQGLVCQNLDLQFLPLGADFAKETNRILTDQEITIIKKIKKGLSFLMVGTIEPRKGYLQVLEAFESLWSKNLDVKLIIVGAEGWRGLANSERRTIPEIISHIKSSSELNKKLFWIEGASDDYLDAIYGSCSCLIMASENEGYGLPLIEAAKINLPIISRDISVFREVLGENATYFAGEDSESLDQAISLWIKGLKEGKVIGSHGVRWLSWKENVIELKKLIKLS